MTKHDFLRELEEQLAAASVEERVAALQYYTEYLDEAGPEHEAEVLAELGDAKAIAADILAAGGTAEGWSPPPRSEGAPAPESGSTAQQGTTLPNAMPQNTAPPPRPTYNRSNNSLAKIILFILLIIIFSPLIGGVGGVLLAVLITVAVAFFIPVILGVAFCFAGIVSCIAGVMLLVPTFGSALVVLGMGLLLFGLGLLCLYGGVMLLGRVMPRAVRAIAGGIGSLWNRLTGKLHGGAV